MQQHTEPDAMHAHTQGGHQDHEIDLLLDPQDSVHRSGHGPDVDGNLHGPTDAARAWHPDTAAMPLHENPAPTADASARRRPFGKATPVILVLALGAIGWWAYDRWIRTEAALPAEPAALSQPAEPSAASNVATVDAAPAQASPAVAAASASAAAAQALPEPTHPDLPAIEAASTLASPSAPGVATPGAMAPTATQDQRLDRLESQLARIESLLTQHSPSQAAPAAAVLPPTSRPPVRARALPPKPVASAKPEEPKPAGQLLSVDIWDGRPSVVLGTGEPADQRVRVLQQGDAYNGITLKSIDVATRRATFDVGQGRLVQLSVEGQ